MHNPEQQVIEILKQEKINFTATLPCDRTKNLLPLVLDSFDGIRLTREEDGVGICAGAWLAGARPMMLIQSTGLGNMINALSTLNEASAIPVPVLASYRGFYKEGIDSQIPFGQRLPEILKGCGVPFTLIEESQDLSRLSDVIQDAFVNCRPHVALVSPKVWENSSCTAWQDNPPQEIRPGDREAGEIPGPVSQPQMTRYEAILSLAEVLEDQALVCNLGIPAKELFQVKDRGLNYYMLGSMGLASSIGLGVSRFTKKKVIVLDGDGAILMNPNALITIGQVRPDNLMILGLDNGVYGSTGSQNTFTQSGMDLCDLARACGIQQIARVSDGQELKDAVRKFEALGQTSFIHAVLRPGNASCPNIPLTPPEITRRFRESLET